MSRAIVISAILALAACAHQDNIWVNGHPAKHNFNQDRFQCLQVATQATPSAAGRAYDPVMGVQSFDLSADARDNLFSACMEARDWHMEIVMVQPGNTVRVE